MARRLAAFGHEVKLISPQFAKPFVKSNKNDFIDAEAICEAASRPAMRYVTPKTESQQTMSALHQVRDSLIHDRVKTSNQIHAFLLEFGISLPIGKAVIERLLVVLAEHRLQPKLVTTLGLHAHYQYLQAQIDDIDRDLALQVKDDKLAQRLMAIPGVGPITARTLAVVISDG